MPDPNDQTQNFIQTYGPLANDISGATGIDSAVILGHIAHESGWGQAIGGNNPFGLTDGRGNKSQYLDIPGAAADYVKLLNSPRYASVAKAGSPQEQIAALTNAGYGPGPVDAANHPEQASGQTYANAIAANAARVRTAGFGVPQQTTNPPPPSGPMPTTAQMEAETNPQQQPMPTAAQMEAETNPGAPQLPAQVTVDTEGNRIGPIGSKPEPTGDASEAYTIPPPRTANPLTTPPGPMLDDAKGAGYNALVAMKGGYDNAPWPLKPIAGPYAAAQSLISSGVNSLVGPALSKIPGIENFVTPSALGRDLVSMPDAYAGSPQDPALGASGKEVPTEKGSVYHQNYYPDSDAAPPTANTPNAPAPTRVAPVAAVDATSVPGEMNAHTDHGYLLAEKRDDGYHVTESGVLPEGAGQGQHTALYKGAIAQAGAEGVPLHIPSPVSPETMRVVANLKDQGYPIDFNSNGTLTINHDTGEVSAQSRDGKPMFTVDTSKIPATPEPAPGSVGAAATPAAQAAMNQRELEATQLTAEKKLLVEPPEARATPGVSPTGSQQNVDTTQYVPGSVPTRAEYMGDPDISLRQRNDFENPDQAGRWTATDNTNNEARVNHFNQQAGSPTTIQTTKAQIAKDFSSRYDDLWANQTPVDAQRISDHIDSVLAGPDGKNSAVVSALNNVKSKLYKNNDVTGDLETSPEQLFGARQEASRLLGSTAKRANPDLGDPRVASNLAAVRSTMDDVIEGGAPGFRQTQADYAEAMKPVDKMELLQDFEPSLYDANNHMTLNKVQNMMKSIVEQRGAPGANQAKSLTNDDMSQLWNLRNDLARRGNIDLGKARGSNTVQNSFMQNLLQNPVLHHAALAPVHFALHRYTGDFTGNALMGAVQGAMASTRTQRAAISVINARKARVDSYLAPPPPPGPQASNDDQPDRTTQYASNEPPPPTPQPGSRPELPMIPNSPPLPYQQPWYLRQAANEPPPTPQPGSRPELPMIPNSPPLPYQTPWYLRQYAANNLTMPYSSSDQPPENDQIDRAPPIEDRLDANTVRNPNRLTGAKGLRLKSRDA